MLPDHALDLFAFALFAIVWLFYEQILKRLRRGRHVNSDMRVLRGAWMRAMASRDNRIMDGQLLGNALHSASFFASSNLILIAAVAGVLFGGQGAWKQVQGLEVLAPVPRYLFEAKLGLVLVCLARGLLDFIWSIRQLNYCLAAMGATPEPLPVAKQPVYGEVLARLLNPALGAFNSGVRGYYFALAAAAWLFGPWAFMTATLGAVGLLFWRQRSSPSAVAIHDFRKLLEAKDPTQPAPPL